MKVTAQVTTQVLSSDFSDDAGTVTHQVWCPILWIIVCSFLWSSHWRWHKTFVFSGHIIIGVFFPLTDQIRAILHCACRFHFCVRLFMAKSKTVDGMDNFSNHGSKSKLAIFRWRQWGTVTYQRKGSGVSWRPTRLPRSQRPRTMWAARGFWLVRRIRPFLSVRTRRPPDSCSDAWRAVPAAVPCSRRAAARPADLEGWVLLLRAKTWRPPPEWLSGDS